MRNPLKMPIRRKDNKWYWGSKGPFDSRKKAEQVSQAAHASGYVSKSDTRLEKALTNINKLIKLSGGRQGAMPLNTLGAGDYGQHVGNPSQNKSKKTKQEEEERLRSN
jgi:hypothetical protein